MTLLTYDETSLNSLGISSTRRGSSYGIGEEAETVREAPKKAYTESIMSYTIPDSFKKFCDLAATWKEETNLKSSLVEISLHPAYQEIIGMGKIVIPWILQELEREPDHWFWALRALTGIDPVRPSERGNMRAMTNAWLKWGKENGYP